VTTEPKAVNGGDALSKDCHPACVACRPRDRGGLGLRFREEPDGGIVGAFGCDAAYQSYPDRLHGGVVAMLLDAAMTHCLFARGVRGVTAKLDIKFRHPVEVGVQADVRARVVSESPPLYVLQGEIVQRDRVLAVAEALFTQLEA